MYILCINRITTQFMDVTNTWQTEDKIWKNVTNFWPNVKTLGITGFLRCQKSDKICPMWQKWDKNVTNCQNMHKYTILCIKMNNYTENLSQIGQIGTKMWQTRGKNGTKFVITSVRCDKLGTKQIYCDK